jgi:hypothetical protein
MRFLCALILLVLSLITLIYAGFCIIPLHNYIGHSDYFSNVWFYKSHGALALAYIFIYLALRIKPLRIKHRESSDPPA